MKKIDLYDVSFFIVVRLDSIQRLENILVVTELLCRFFNTNVYVLEAAYINSKILSSMLKSKWVSYTFLEDKDPVFYKTKYFNLLLNNAPVTPIIALWDTDVVVDKNAIMDAVIHLRNNEADVAYPYSGEVLETSDMLRRIYLTTKNIKELYRNKSKMDFLYNQAMVGGAVLVNREKFISAGAENEQYYGWGDEDFDRHARFVNLGYKIYAANNCLFHLSHPRASNNQFRDDIQKMRSKRELQYVKNCSKKELLDYIAKNNYKSVVKKIKVQGD